MLKIEPPSGQKKEASTSWQLWTELASGGRMRKAALGIKALLLGTGGETEKPESLVHQCGVEFPSP